MRLSKAQLRVVEALQNNGYIWIAAGCPYLVKEVDGVRQSVLLNKKVFQNLKEHKVIVEHSSGNRWILR